MIFYESTPKGVRVRYRLWQKLRREMGSSAKPPPDAPKRAKNPD